MSQQPPNPPASPPPSPGPSATSTGLQENIEGLLCYLGGWITGLIFFLIEKKSKFVRFHAIQSIAISIVLFILSFVPVVNLFVWILSVVLWILMMVMAYQGKMYKLPIIGNYAEKQAEKPVS